MANGKPRGRILVAEDNVANQKVIQHTLERLGYSADVASNGKEAVEMWSSFPYQSILMDCAMPEMDGFEATAEIRRREELGEHVNRIPIIALTANAMKGDREKCLGAGMDDYLSKPFKREELGAILERWVQLGSTDGGRNGHSPKRSQADSTGGTAVDAETIEDLRETMADKFNDYVQIFLKEALEQLESIRMSVTDGDTETLIKTAHSLKSSSGFIGAERMSDICRKLQALGRSGTMTEVSILAKNLEEEYIHVRACLENSDKTVSSN